MCGSIGPVKNGEIDTIISSRDTAESQKLVEEGINLAAGKRMKVENSSLYFLYSEIGAINFTLDKDAIRKGLWSDRYLSDTKLSTLAIPVLCMSGEEDMITPPDAVKILSSLLPNAQLALIPKTGHSVYFERPEIFNATIDRFLGRVK